MGTSTTGWFTVENHMNMDDLGILHDLGNLHFMVRLWSVRSRVLSIVAGPASEGKGPGLRIACALHIPGGHKSLEQFGSPISLCGCGKNGAFQSHRSLAEEGFELMTHYTENVADGIGERSGSLKFPSFSSFLLILVDICVAP